MAMPENHSDWKGPQQVMQSKFLKARTALSLSSQVFSNLKLAFSKVLNSAVANNFMTIALDQ